MPYNILIIDDEEDIRDLISDALNDEGYKTRTAGESMSAFNMINEYTPHLIILDIWLQGSELDGLGILEIVKEKYPDLPVIIISGHGTIETAVSAIKMGAYDYIEKPFTEDKLIVTVKRAIDFVKLTQENIQYKIDLKYKTKLIASSQNMAIIKSNLDKAAQTNSRIHLIGATGTGKDSCARYIHSKSRRANEAFIIFDASNIDQKKAQIELFGDEYIPGIHEQNRKIGLLELANSGTLFINEVGDLPINIQNKLLKFLQDQSFQRPGTDTILKLDIRIISSSTRDLLLDVKEGKFRQDLYYRLAVVPILLPTLSKRKEDISLLCEHFIGFFAETSGLAPRKISNEAMNTLIDYSWPGNIRQLRNIVELLLIMAQNSQIDVINSDLLPPEILSGSNNIIKPEKDIDVINLPLREAREIFEKQYLAAQMQRFNGNISKTSNFVGMERSALHRKLKSLNIHSASSTDINNEEESLVE